MCSAKLDATETWLYDEGFDSTKTIYAGKLAELKVGLALRKACTAKSFHLDSGRHLILMCMYNLSYRNGCLCLQSLGDPIERRLDEASKRDAEKADFVSSLEEFKNLVKNTEDKYSHITDEERSKVSPRTHMCRTDGCACVATSDTRA
jgi:hypothetical protein